jgi:hypothetical protein
VFIAFTLGGLDLCSGWGALLIAPDKASFFVRGLTDLQGTVRPDEIPSDFVLMLTDERLSSELKTYREEMCRQVEQADSDVQGMSDEA